MNNYPNQINVAKAVKHRSTFPLDFQHLTTMDFGKTNILHTMEVMPNDELDFDVSSLVQLAPMIVPSMGQVNLTVRAFFVPYRFVWTNWEEFISTMRHAKGSLSSVTKVPTIPSYLITQYFTDVQYGNSVLVGTEETADFTIADMEGGRFRFTYKGRLHYQILLGLGYTLTLALNPGEDVPSSAMPLLSLAKIFRDYYVNPNYEYTSIDEILYHDFNDSSPSLNLSALSTILDFVSFSWFENDLFTSAWKNPESAQYSRVFGDISVSDVVRSVPGGVYSELITSPSDDGLTRLRQQVNGSNAYLEFISQYGLNLLKSVRNFVLRRSVSGARYVDQMLSRFGINLPNNEARRATFIGSYEVTPRITRVDATAAGSAQFPDGNTLRTALGDYSGRGDMAGNGHFHFVNDKNDFGVIVFVAHMMPRTSYYQGIKPHTRHINYADFFDADREDCGMTPIPNMDLLANSADFANENEYRISKDFLQGVFGFAPYGFDYKSQTDYLSGDFRCNSLNVPLKAFSLMRELDIDTVGETPVVLDENFQKANEDNISQFNRIFLTSSNDADHFICSFLFKVRATRDCNSLGNSILAELNEHGNDVGSLVKVRPNGKFF